MNSKMNQGGKLIILVLMGMLLSIFPKKITGQPLYIAYTTNLNCNLEACYCGGNQLGGMIQLVGAIDSLRSRHPDLILLDSGDFMNSYPLTQGNHLMVELMKDFRYDAIGLGEQEFIEGAPFLINAYLDGDIPLVSANVSIQSDKLKHFPPYLIMERGMKKVGVISVLFPEVYDPFFSSNVQMESPIAVLDKYLNTIRAEVDVLILLCHGSYDSGNKMAERFPQIDLVIAGHTQEREAIQKNSQLIVQAGRDGEYLGLVSINWKDDEKQFSNSFLPIDLRYGINYSMKNKIDQYYQRY